MVDMPEMRTAPARLFRVSPEGVQGTGEAMNYTYDDSKRPFYEAAYDLLVKHAGARDSEDARESFVLAFTQVEYPCGEYRFQGSLGFGGKFYREDYASQKHWVGCYPEDRTPTREMEIRIVNGLLAEMRP